MSSASVPANGKHKPSDAVTLKITSQDGKEVFFRVKRTTKLKKLLLAYCEKKFLDYKTLRFLIDGSRFSADETPDKLGLEDGDEINAMVQMEGGGGYLVI